MERVLQLDTSQQPQSTFQPSDHSNFDRHFDLLINEESDALGHDSRLFESSEVLAPDMLDLDAFMSFDANENDQFVADNAAAHERQETFNLLATGELCYESPKSSRNSEESQSIIPESYGPGCWLSVCSPPGLAWIQQRTGVDEFTGIAADLTVAWAKQLRLERNEPTLRTSEPESELAWKYSYAYFERSVDSIFEVVYRPEFESHLRRHFENRQSNDDPAWYALRNAVYASGCRLHHCESHAASFTNIQEEAWGYFSNALSVHSELLLRSPSLRAVRALLAMALFAEGLGSPALGSGLIANAIFLSQSLGLHKKVLLPELALDPETLQRSWLFWAVYCCEKNIARRTGRSSVIDDDDISCDIPAVAHSRSTIDPIIMKYIVESCQISSRICKKLMSAKRLDNQPGKFLGIVAEFDNELRKWKNSIPVAMRPKDHLKQFEVSQNVSSLEKILIQSSYYDLMMVIHAPLSYPWITNRIRCDLNTNIRARIETQIAQSSEETARAARNIIIMARNFEINGANTHAFMLHYPMHAFINLFIYVIQSPRLESVRTDLALLDVAAGYFGQMDFITGSKLSFPFTRDIATFGRQIMDTHASRPANLPPYRGVSRSQIRSVALG
ncbi:uncharacterized protein Z519_00954 [Cladophialophora bantiana CBS 173.52]|uniref:Xylanolytic transcriptional activator regulatory domain-containing protein n=1 Tax=Cladophialophora bantiana (strain ATCC 10958 / CBS 173.52 / CDC B-1940 / NIH 8579) TaxID=1442370 RepID=A0A0D2FAZ0_CLAB1|nr:uncharacterized protein Z519_00954 [Cladophialophora bantiana CBS 173.52]KIW99291.1 hypothetical protein Z519_00954 [Cladophialophora bantiana CBS 173.52]